MTGSFQEVPTSGDMQNIRLSKRAGLRTLTCHCSDYSSLQERHPSCLRKGCRLFGRTFQCSLKLFSCFFMISCKGWKLVIGSVQSQLQRCLPFKKSGNPFPFYLSPVTRIKGGDWGCLQGPQDLPGWALWTFGGLHDLRV